MKFQLVILLIVLVCTQAKFNNQKKVNSIEDLKEKLGDIDPEYYQNIVAQIQNKVNTDLKGASYDRLAYIVDTYGPRVWGSETLEIVIDEMIQQGKDVDFDKVYKDPVVDFTSWERGTESLTLYDPRPFPQDLKMIGLGWSVPGDVKAEVLVVKDWDDLELKKNEAKGKIVCYSYQWSDYGESVRYRGDGASKAAEYGAVGTLVRSVTPFSIESPHTGSMGYNSNYPKIPAAAISVEDANMFLRMQERGQKIVVHLKMNNREKTGQNSANVIAEITGSENPEEIILFGGHIDSWDTGSQTGANDDGGGFMTCFEALRVIKELGLKPKRTMRFIAWSGEEMGGWDSGAQQYVQNNYDEMDNHILAFESDEGSTSIFGFGFTGSDEAMLMIEYIQDELLKPELDFIKSQVRPDGTMVDTDPLANQGIPTIKNLVQDLNDQTHPYYFTFHHSAGDSMDIMFPDQMDENVIAIAAMMFIVADIEPRLPR